MFENHDVVCAIELGTSKVGVLLGAVDNREQPEIIGCGFKSISGAVVKGEIFDMELAFDALSQAIEDADNSSGRKLADCRMAVVLATGCGIDFVNGIGNVAITNEGRVVTENDMNLAQENGSVVNLASDREVINTAVSYFMLDERRLINPLQQTGSRLEARVHVVHAISSRIANFRSIVQQAGFENVRVEPVFSAFAVEAGIVGDLDREHGMLLIDLGAGCTEYLVEFDRGIRNSGMIQIGMEHVANDLSIGLSLPIEICRRILMDGTLKQAVASKQEYLKLPANIGTPRKIPIRNFEMIVDARIQEIFLIIRKRLLARQAVQSLCAGGILTGGGALFYRTREIFKEVFEMSCRIGQPSDAEGVVTDIANPRYSALWGGLKISAHYYNIFGERRSGVFTKMIDSVNRSIDKAGVRGWKLWK